MKGLQYICYVSSAVGRMSEHELEARLEAERAFNASASVTGVLFHDDGNFFQYIEGPADGVEAAYASIKKSSHHAGIIEMMRDSIAVRAFPTWLMAHVSRSRIISLQTAGWQQLRAQLTAADGPNLGLVLLRDHLQIANVAV